MQSDLQRIEWIIDPLLWLAANPMNLSPEILTALPSPGIGDPKACPYTLYLWRGGVSIPMAAAKSDAIGISLTT